MVNSFKIVKIDTDYCNYLRTFDNRVPYNAGRKELRPFIGVLFVVEQCEYFAPLSSPKAKHKLLRDNFDLVKIDDGNLGVINLNNMIPVKKGNYELFDLKNAKDEDARKRNALLSNQLRWLIKYRKDILYKAKSIYIQYKKGSLPKSMMERCCDFPLLEEKCAAYENAKVCA